MRNIVDIPKQKRNKSSRRHRQHTLKMPIKLGVTSIGFITLMIICFLALLYLIQANRTATYGFKIEEYDDAISKLKKEQSELELEAAKLRSTNQIKENLDKLNMQEVDLTKVVYYKTGGYLALEKGEEVNE
jgi:cell division protein FtsL